MKLLASELAADERFRERFLRESRLAASLDHPAIVPIYQAGEADGQLFIAMRFVEGSDLRELLAEGPLEPGRALAILSQVASALDTAHRRGLVHRDVKPGNVLLDEEGHAYLSDFGLTKQASSQSGLTQTGQLVGTLDYVAPEQIEGREVDGRADVYSLACVLYECLTGRRPYERETEVALLWAHMHEPPPAVGEAAIDAVLARGLAKNPSERPASASELVAGARRAVGLSTGEFTSPTSLARRRVDRRLLALAVALVLVAAPAVALLVWGGGSPGLASVAVNSVGVIDPATNRILASIPVGGVPSRVAAGPSGIWVADTSHGTVERLDPESNAIAATIGLGVRATDVAVDRDGVWATSSGDGTLVQVDAAREVVNQSIRVRAPGIAVDAFVGKGFPTTVVAGGGAVWADGSPSTITRVVAGAVQSRLTGIDTGVSALAFGERALWVVGENTPRVLRIDPRSERQSSISVASDSTEAPFLSSLAVGAGTVWVTTLPSQGPEQFNSGPDRAKPGRVVRLDPDLGAVTTTIDVGADPVAVAIGTGAVWVANARDGTISRIDPRTNTVVKTIMVGHAPTAITVAAGKVWVSVAEVAPS